MILQKIEMPTNKGQDFKQGVYSVPIKEFVALTVMILGGIYVAHPFDFQNEVRKVEASILKEISNTHNWGNPGFSGAKKYIQNHPIIYSNGIQNHSHLHLLVQSSSKN
jgi:hypothetical protein